MRSYQKVKTKGVFFRSRNSKVPNFLDTATTELGGQHGQRAPQGLEKKHNYYNQQSKASKASNLILQTRNRPQASNRSLQGKASVIQTASLKSNNYMSTHEDTKKDLSELLDESREGRGSSQLHGNLNGAAPRSRLSNTKASGTGATGQLNNPARVAAKKTAVTAAEVAAAELDDHQKSMEFQNIKIVQNLSPSTASAPYHQNSTYQKKVNGRMSQLGRDLLLISQSTNIKINPEGVERTAHQVALKSRAGVVLEGNRPKQVKSPAAGAALKYSRSRLGGNTLKSLIE